MGGKDFSEQEIREILARAYNLGVTLIDTGPYRSHGAERLIGSAIGTRRGDFIIATKFGHDTNTGAGVWREADIMRQLDASLSALRSDYIDIYQIHINTSADRNGFLSHAEDIAQALGKAKTAGKIRYSGISLGDDTLLDATGELLQHAIDIIGVDVVQVVYNRLDRGAEERIFPIAERSGLGVITRVSLAKGYLSSHFQPKKEYDEARLQRVTEIKKREVPEGTDLAEWAIAWCLRHNAVSTVAPGCSTVSQLDSTVRALELVKTI